MRILIVGGGGREHALAWKLSQDAEVFAAPGNPGIAKVATCIPVKTDDFAGIAQACSSIRADLVVVGPEAPLIAGLADSLRAQGIAVFGPGKAAALLEGSKAFSKALMAEVGVPTAAFRSFDDPRAAKEAAREAYGAGRQLVVKASGPALGKGALVTSTLEEALEAIHLCMEAAEFGEAGRVVVLEERLQGREFSLLSLCSGTDFRSLPAAQDYKRAFDDNLGPNTGGMGSVSPVSWVDSSLLAEAEEQVVRPILESMAAKGMPFNGVLFSGLILTEDGPKCIEYNVRFGDPEIQSVVRRLGLGLPNALMAAAHGEPIPEVEMLNNAAASIVLASEGYPSAATLGKEVSEFEPEDGVLVFQAGTKMVEGRLVTSGGRVAAVTAVAPSLSLAVERAYRNLNCFRFEGATWRTDIGREAVATQAARP